MKAADLNINLPLNFNQVVDLVKQLPYKEKLRLAEVLKKETVKYQKSIPVNFIKSIPVKSKKIF